MWWKASLPTFSYYRFWKEFFCGQSPNPTFCSGHFLIISPLFIFIGIGYVLIILYMRCLQEYINTIWSCDKLSRYHIMLFSCGMPMEVMEWLAGLMNICQEHSIEGNMRTRSLGTCKIVLKRGELRLLALNVSNVLLWIQESWGQHFACTSGWGWGETETIQANSD